MRCNRLQELIPGYLDGSLSGRQNRLAADHLDGCERCRAELSSQQRALRTLDAGRHAITIDLWADFSRRLQEQSPPPVAAWRRLWQPGIAVAAAVAVIALISTRPAPVLSPTATDVVPVKIASSVIPDELAESRAMMSVAAPRHKLGPRTETPSTHSKPGLVEASYRMGHGYSIGSHRITRRGHRSWPPSASPSLVRPRRAVPRVYQLAQLPMSPLDTGNQDSSLGNSLEAQLPDRMNNLSPAVEPTGSVEAATRPVVSSAKSGDPLRVALALAAVEKDTASHEMGGELLRMAREVARVSGEAGGADLDRIAPGTEPMAGDGRTDRSSPTGT